MQPVIGQKGVKYGLSLPKKQQAAAAPPPRRPSVFGDDASDEEEENVEQQIARQAARKQSDKQVAELHAAALAEDAAIFDYDAHYDDIQRMRAEPKKQEKLARQSRYIAGLLEKAEERKMEADIQYERRLAKEREAEDAVFGEKERFVTAAYRAKLAENAKWKEAEARRKAREEAEAADKKGHMGDFYRNILRNNVAFGTAAPGRAPEKKEEPELAQPSASEPELEPEPAAERAQPAAPLGRDQRMLAPGGEARPAEPDRGAEGRGRGGPLEGEAPVAPAARAEPPAAPAAPRQEGPPPAAAAPAAPRDRESAVASARERYLARKRKQPPADG